MVGKKAKKVPPAPRIGRSINQEDWRGQWPGHLTRIDLYYRSELRRLGIWPPPPERMVFEGAPGI